MTKTLTALIPMKSWNEQLVSKHEQNGTSSRCASFIGGKMKITSEELLNVCFSSSLIGYDRKEVDEFLDAAAEEMRNMEREKEEMLAALDSLMKEIERMNDRAESTESEEKLEKEIPSPKKAPIQREKKASAEKQNGRGTALNMEKIESEASFSDQDMIKESVAPSRHILRGTGERNKRSLPSFLHPHPIESQDARKGRNGEEEPKATEGDEEKKSAGSHLQTGENEHAEIRMTETDLRPQNGAGPALEENSLENANSAGKDCNSEENR